MLLSYAQCAKLKFTQAKIIVALGFDHPLKDYQGGSEDLCVYMHDEYTEDERVQVERLRAELRIYAESSNPAESRSYQFPVARENQSDTNIVSELAVKKQGKAKKSRNKNQKQARRANRKK